MKNLFIFYTEHIDIGEETKDYLAAIDGTVKRDDYYINANDGFVFYNAKKFLEDEDYKELFKDTLEKIKGDFNNFKEIENIFVFFHGSDLGERTFLTEKTEIAEELKKIFMEKYNKSIELYAYYYSHDPNDDLSFLLTEYKKALQYAGIHRYDNLNEAVEKYIKG